MGEQLTGWLECSLRLPPPHGNSWGSQAGGESASSACPMDNSWDRWTSGRQQLPLLTHLTQGGSQLSSFSLGLLSLERLPLVYLPDPCFLKTHAHTHTQSQLASFASKRLPSYYEDGKIHENIKHFTSFTKRMLQSLFRI